jgi:hypothetical protein
VQATLDDLENWGAPAVLHVDGNHYIAYMGHEAGRVHVFDNSIGDYDCSPEYFKKRYRWPGLALVVGGVPWSWSRILRSPVSCLLLVASCALLVRARIARPVRPTPDRVSGRDPDGQDENVDGNGTPAVDSGRN